MASKRWLIIFAAVVLVVCFYVAWVNKAPFYTEAHAKEIAVAEFRKYCTEMSENAGSFEGPKRVEMGGAPWAFEWKSEKAHKLVGVRLDASGSPTIYAGEE